jgi:hypothetical protein
LRLAQRTPVGEGTRALWRAAGAVLDPELADRPLSGDVEAARRLVEAWAVELA